MIPIIHFDLHLAMLIFCSTYLADDSHLHWKIQQKEIQLKIDFKPVVSWFLTNKIGLNKTKPIIFRNKHLKRTKSLIIIT